jgi:hypothetical protein
MESSTIIEVDFAELSDGTLVEMIEDPAGSGKSVLAIYKDRTVRYSERLDDGGRILVPLPRANHDLRHVGLAQGAEPYGTLLELQALVASFFYECLDIEMEWSILLTACAISTWFPERLPVAPYIAFVGPPGSGKTTAMRVFSLLCYRSLLASDITSAAFYDISDRIHPTLLLDETLTAGNSREILHLLKASSTPGFVSLRKDKAQLAYGPKVFSWLELPDDSALNSRCLIVPMHKTSRTDLKRPNDPRILAAAKKVRMRLQQFRFEHYNGFPQPTVPSEAKLSGRPLDLYRAVALPFDQDQNMCRMLAFLIERQNDFQGPLLSPAQASVLKVLYRYIHKMPDAAATGVSILTAIVNSDLDGRGEPALKERKMGNILTSLSLTNRPRGKNGYVLVLDRATRERIHATVREHKIENPVDTCRICNPTGAPPAESTGAEGAKKEEIPSVKSTRYGERGEHGERGKRQSCTNNKRLRSSSQNASEFKQLRRQRKDAAP